MKKSRLSTPSIFEKRWWGSFILVLLLLWPVTDILASVLVAPTVVFLSDKNRTGRLIIRNPTNKAQEVEIRMGFGLPISDSAGNVRVNLVDSGVTDIHCAMNWVKPFPRKLILGPGKSQTVRFVASPPKNIEDGEYWARIIIRSQASEAEPEQPDSPEKITTKLNMIMQTAVSLKYRTGDLFSELEMTDARASLKDGIVNVLLDLKNNGNVSYLGILNCRLLDKNGNELSSQRIDLAVYYDLRRKIELPISGIRAEPPYQVEILITNEGRTDIEPKDRIRAKDVEYSMSVD
jgi:P pilus assembly chaperone PapD